MTALPFIHSHLAIMPDVHAGVGSTVGTVIPTSNAIVPAAVGVDIGCGMIAVRLDLRAEDLPDNLFGIRSAIEARVPHGRTGNGDPDSDRGAWGRLPEAYEDDWRARAMDKAVQRIADKAGTKRLARAAKTAHRHLGTLGSGNHFVELCLDENNDVWIMIHSGSRGIGTSYIEKAQEEMRRWHINLPDKDLAYLPEGSRYFDEYVEAMVWAQDFAALSAKRPKGRSPKQTGLPSLACATFKTQSRPREAKQSRSRSKLSGGMTSTLSQRACV